MLALTLSWLFWLALGIFIDRSVDATDLSYEVSVTDSEGQDHSQLFEIFHSPPGTRPSRLQKRINSRPLDGCPAGETFSTSYCREGVSPQAYTLVCDDGLDYSWYFRRCTPSEICIQGVPKQNPPLPDGQLVPPTLKAYCVTAEHFVKIAVNAQTHATTPNTIGQKYTAPDGKIMAVEAVLTGPDMTQSIFAARLEMRAQTSDSLSNVQAWRSQVGGVTACTDCARVLIAPVPQKTQRIVIKVILEAAALGGRLFLSSVAM
ncbi:MAG: hypothetical protein Q9174_004005 [Haloplaca sp. 1 TL-2023]